MGSTYEDVSPASEEFIITPDIGLFAGIDPALDGPSPDTSPGTLPTPHKLSQTSLDYLKQLATNVENGESTKPTPQNIDTTEIGPSTFRSIFSPRLFAPTYDFLDSIEPSPVKRSKHMREGGRDSTKRVTFAGSITAPADLATLMTRTKTERKTALIKNVQPDEVENYGFDE